MSNDALNWAWAAPLAGGPKFVLVALADKGSAHGQEDWTAWPAVETLCTMTGQGDRTVRRHLEGLEAEGWISRRRQVRPDGKLGFYTYRLHRAKLEQALAELEEPAANLAGGEGDQPAANLANTTGQFGQKPAANLAGQEPLEEPLENPHNASEPGDDGFEEAFTAWPESGRVRTDYRAARTAWAWCCSQETPARLMAAIAKAAADPRLAKGDYGFPGLHNWLSQERWRAFLPAVDGGGAAAGLPGGATVKAEARTAFALPADLAAVLQSIGGVSAWLHRATWCEADRTVVAWSSTGRDRLLELIGRRRLLELQINVACRGEHGGSDA